MNTASSWFLDMRVMMAPARHERLLPFCRTNAPGSLRFLATKTMPKSYSSLGGRCLRSWSGELRHSRRSSIEEISTFGYRNTVDKLGKLLFRDDSLLWKYDVHFAADGSKLQTIGCWVFSRAVPSITMITSVPKHYYKKAFSRGIGPSWVFPLTQFRA